MDAVRFLKADNKIRHSCSVMLNSTPIPNDYVELKKYVSKLGPVDSGDVLIYRGVMFGEDTEEMSYLLVMSDECIFKENLEIDGNDLLNLGFKGKLIGETLDKLLLTVIEGKVKNNKESLITIAKNIDNR